MVVFQISVRGKRAARAVVRTVVQIPEINRPPIVPAAYLRLFLIGHTCVPPTPSGLSYRGAAR